MGRISRATRRNTGSKIAKCIGDQLLKLRQRDGVTMRTVASKTGLSNAFICQLENGQSEPSASTLFKLSQCFDVPIGYFFRTYDGE